MSIIELQEVEADTWQAKYRGNYGVYKIKVEYEGAKVKHFSCSCPSDYYPCKHIAMIKDAIKEQRNKKPKNTKNEVSVGQVLEKLSADELRNFIIKQSQYNPQLKSAVLLEFAHKAGNDNANNYATIIRSALSEINIDYDDFYEDYYDDNSI